MSYRFLRALFLCLTASLCCKPKDQLPSAPIPDAVILCFHDVGREGRYAISFRTFSAILDDLQPYRVVSAADWLRGQKSGETKKKVILTFDDGYRSHREIVLPELMRRGYGATFFFYNEQLVQDKKWREMLKDLPNTFEIGSHSWSHSTLAYLSGAPLFRELYLAREHLTELAGKPSRAFAWPYGSWSPESVKAAHAAGFDYLYSVDYRVARSTDVPDVIPRYTVMGRGSREQVRSILAAFERRVHDR